MKVYPWKSAAVISTIVLGALILVIFGLWEAYATLPEPVVPVKLFKNIHWVAASCLLGLGASIYYGKFNWIPATLQNVSSEWVANIEKPWRLFGLRWSQFSIQ